MGARTAMRFDLVDLGLFIAVADSGSITQGALPFLLPLMMQISFGMSAAESGLLTFATACGAMTMKAAAGEGCLRM